MDDKLRDLLCELPAEKPASDLDARIMARVRQEKTHLEKRSEWRTLAWTIGLAAVVLGLGAYVLYTYIDWSALRLPEVEKDYSAYARQFNMLLPFAGIVLLLLLGDSLLRRHVFMKRQRK